LATITAEWDPALDNPAAKGRGESIVPTGAAPNVQLAMPRVEMDKLVGKPALTLINLTYTGSTIQSATFAVG
jgi:hypothetical protein